MSKKPKDAKSHVVLFLNSYGEHQRLIEAFPVSTSKLQLVGEMDAQRERDHWHRIVRAASVRKYILLSRENVYIPTVLARCRELLPADQHKWLDYGQKLFEQCRDHSVVRVQFGNNDEMTVPQLVKDFLHGVFAHSDEDKFSRYQANRNAMEVALGVWLVDMEAYLQQFVASLAQWLADGSIDLGEDIVKGT